MRKVLVTVVLLVLVACAHARQRDPASGAEALFARGEYGKGFGLLNRALRDRDMGPLQRARALKTMAQFYEEMMGNTDGALRYYRKIFEARLPADHPIRSLARNEISRLKSLEQKYSEQNALLKRSRIVSSRRGDENEVAEQITELQALIKENPEYHKLAEAYYYLAQNYMYAEEYGKAYRQLKQSAELKPCISYYLPVKARAQVAYKRWVVSIINTIVWGTLAALLIVTICVFYTARPWRWIRWRHLALGLAMVLLWWIVFNVSFEWLGAGFEVTKKLISEIYAELPAFVSAQPGSPGSQVAKHLFVYGLIGVLGMFVFSVGIGKFKYRWAAFVLNSVFGLLLFASLTTVFYLRHCDGPSRFNSQGNSILYYPKGALCFFAEEPEPYILTNPSGYSDLRVSSIDDPVLQEWVKQHCPFRPPQKPVRPPRRK
ncbi:MAG: hypothetical protein ACYTEL_15425 [Planctomycetota bacterium]